MRVLERNDLMLDAYRKVTRLMGQKGVKYEVREQERVYEQEVGRRAKGHGRHRKKGGKAANGGATAAA